MGKKFTKYWTRLGADRVASGVSLFARSTRVYLPAAFLLVAVAVVFWPPRHVEFLNCDDDVYVAENPYVAQGLSWASARWAFTSVHENYWMPATWLSFMLDSDLFGLNPRGFRFGNVFLHGIAAALLYFLLFRLTRHPASSCLAALLFALHPLRLESVAWISERKDVLGAVFALLALHAYVSFVRNRRRLPYAVAVASFVCSLLAKPAFVPFPLALLILDAWPLRRMEREGCSWRSCLVEKLPMFLVAGAFALLTLFTQATSLHSVGEEGWFARIAGVIGSHVFYLAKMVWPYPLSVAYAAQQPAGVWLFGAFGLLMGVAVACWLLRRRFPGAWMSWLWFVVMLLPVAGWIRVGTVHVADRFTYAPAVGLAIALAFGFAALARVASRWAYRTAVASALMLVAVFAGVTSLMLPLWSTSEALFRHAVAVSPNQPFARNNYGVVLMDQGRCVEAAGQFQEALKLDPVSGPAQLNLALTYDKAGRSDEALALLDLMIQHRPDQALLYNNRGAVLAKQDRVDEAAASFADAVRLAPADIHARYNYALILRQLDRVEEAQREAEEMIRRVPGDGRAYWLIAQLWLDRNESNRALPWLDRSVALAPASPESLAARADVLLRLNRPVDAASDYQRLLALNDSHVEALNALAWIYGSTPVGSALHRPAQAVDLAERAAALSGHKDPSVLDTLAVAYAADHRFKDAVRCASQALDIAARAGHEQLAKEIRARLEVFRGGEAWIDKASGPDLAGS